MSTGLNCEFNEVERGQWYYIIEDWSAPKMAWDWRGFATAYGPFATFDDAEEHLRCNHANPGGYMINKYKEDSKPDDVMQRLIATARRAA